MVLSSMYVCASYSPPIYGQEAAPNVLFQQSNLETKILEDKEEKPLSQPYRFSEQDLNKYRRWKQQAIDHSKKTGEVVLIINKSTYELDVYQKGQFQKKFPIELGKNNYDDKKIQGDNTTPEGFYKIRKVKDINNTHFYRAAELDYPNKQDIAEFHRLKKTGAIPKNATIGGDINIHGKGSGISPLQGGSNWTQGCAALSNEDMDELFQYLKQETQVLIIKYDSPIISIIPPDSKTVIKHLKYLTKSIDQSIFK